MNFGELYRFGAIVSIDRYVDNAGIRAIGSLQYCVDGKLFGSARSDASALAASYDNSVRFISAQGRHKCEWQSLLSAEDIAFGYIASEYAGPIGWHGVPLAPDHVADIHRANCLLAPDGDAAFDDGSFVFAFDTDERFVRIIATKNADSVQEMRRSFASVTVSSADFYGVLEDWAGALLRREI